MNYNLTDYLEGKTMMETFLDTFIRQSSLIDPQYSQADYNMIQRFRDREFYAEGM